MTSVQTLEGIFMDVMFITEEEFNIKFTGNKTDLRMVKIYYDIGNEKVLKNEKNKN